MMRRKWQQQNELNTRARRRRRKVLANDQNRRELELELEETEEKMCLNHLQLTNFVWKRLIDDATELDQDKRIRNTSKINHRQNLSQNQAEEPVYIDLKSIKTMKRVLTHYDGQSRNYSTPSTRLKTGNLGKLLAHKLAILGQVLFMFVILTLLNIATTISEYRSFVCHFLNLV